MAVRPADAAENQSMAPPTDESYDHHRGALPLLREVGRLRWGFFAAVNLAIFAAANAFWQYLTTGRWLDFSLHAYRRDLATPLGEVLLRPLSAFSHPWMVLVVGVLLAVILVVPVLMSVMYRLLLAAVFLALVAFVGHAPVLAVVLGVGCLLAGRTRLRSDLPFLAVLLGLLPAGAYLYFFVFFGADSAAVQPLQRLVLAAPFVLAVVVAVLASAAVLGLARFTGFRPDVAWPVLLLLLAAAAVAFYARVGGDELEYSLVTENLAAGDAVFEPLSLETWSRQNRTEGLNAQTLRIRIQDDLQRRRQELIDRCLSFVGRYPGSERAAAVLWVAAQAASLQLDGPALDIGLIKCSASHPLGASAGLWERLADSYGRSPQAGVAHWQLGELAMRRGDVRAAYQHLVRAQEALSSRPVGAKAAAAGPSVTEVFAAMPSEPADRYYTEAAFAVRRLLWLMDFNDVLNDPPSAEAMAAYLDCDPHDSRYLDRLSELAGTYEHTRLGDNLKLAVALACPNVYERAEMLILLAERPNSDAAIEANYELGRLAMRTAEAPALVLVENLRKAEDYFRAIQAAGPSPWKALAEEYLASRASASQPVPASRP
jgi:hypothetical protein